MTTRYEDPKSAPFAIGQKVRYIGPSFTIALDSGWKPVNTGDVGQCVKIKPGRKGGGFLGYDEDTGEPDYAPTQHDRSTVKFACGYQADVDCESHWFETA